MKRFALVFAGAALALSLHASEDPSPTHVQWMKDLDAQIDAIRANKDVAANAKAAQATNKLVAAFWKTRNSADAAKAADTANQALTQLLAAAQANDAEAVTAAAKLYGTSCRTCHTAHREKLPGGIYKIK